MSIFHKLSSVRFVNSLGPHLNNTPGDGHRSEDWYASAVYKRQGAYLRIFRTPITSIFRKAALYSSRIPARFHSSSTSCAKMCIRDRSTGRPRELAWNLKRS